MTMREHISRQPFVGSTVTASRQFVLSITRGDNRAQRKTGRMNEAFLNRMNRIILLPFTA